MLEGSLADAIGPDVLLRQLAQALRGNIPYINPVHATITQLGGSVGGLGMIVTHQPPLVQTGDRVTIDVARRSMTTATTSLLPVGGTATYGVQRTIKSRKPLWRAGGCVELTYDAWSIHPPRAKLIDAAFAAWSAAAIGCGRVVVTSTRQANPSSARLSALSDSRSRDARA